MIIVCPVCKLEFNSKKQKTYCSMRCYLSSEQFKTMELTNLNNINKDTKGPIKVKCKNCENEYFTPRWRPKKFCSKICLRIYYKERFDRFIANPETIALPQAYDEYLTKENLPCLFNDCDWVGKNLSSHVNRTHGITAREFKKLAGFNLKSGLVTPDLSKQMSDKAFSQNLAQYRPDNSNKNLNLNRESDYRSLEGREHWAKSVAYSRAKFIEAGIKTARSSKFKDNARERIKRTKEENSNNLIEKTCPQCKKVFNVPIMKSNQIFCSKECKKEATYIKFGKEKIYDIICCQCLCTFKGTYQQMWKQSKGTRVFCSRRCISAYHVVHFK